MLTLTTTFQDAQIPNGDGVSSDLSWDRRPKPPVANPVPA